MTDSAFEPGQYIDLVRFPIHDLDGAEGRGFVARCRAELADTGACNLESFIRSDAAQAMAADALALIPLAYEKNTRRNAYFSKEGPSLPPDHPMRAFFPLRMSQLANDAIPKTAVIQRLYEWDPLTDYIRLVLGLEALYRIADPFLALNLTYLKSGDLQPWHYDHNEFTVTLLLQEIGVWRRVRIRPPHADRRGREFRSRQTALRRHIPRRADSAPPARHSDYLQGPPRHASGD